MHCFCAKCAALDDDKKLHTYDLYSVIVHVGQTICSGHYIAFTRLLEGYRYDINCTEDNCQQKDCCGISMKNAGHNVSTWYKCDDDIITAMSQSEFEKLLLPNRRKNLTPYILFYVQSDVQ